MVKRNFANLNTDDYFEMGFFDNNRVNIKYKKNDRISSLTIKGKNLVVSKLKNKEVLILGNISNLEFR